MKKSLLAVAAMTAFAGAAQAQSSVTVYGILDVGFVNSSYTGTSTTANASNVGNSKTATYVGNAGQKQVTNGFGQSAESTSRLGFKGTEDLGGGMSALFTVEMGLAPNNQLSTSSTQTTTSGGNLTFNRQTFAGLKKNGVGTATIGTQYTPIFDVMATSDAAGLNNLVGNAVYSGTLQSSGGIYNNGLGPYAGNANQSANAYTGAFTTRLSNSLKLQSDNFAGFTGQIFYAQAAQNQTETATFAANGGGVNNNTAWGLNGNYTWNKLNVVAAYQNIRNFDNGLAPSTTTTNDASTGAGGTATSFGTNMTDNQTYAGVNYDFGILKAYYQFITRKATSVYDSSYQTKRTANQIGVRSQLTPSISAYATLGLTNAAYYGQNQASANGRTYQIGVDYYLSKRTNLYVAGGAANQSSNGSNVSGSSVATSALAGGVGTSASNYAVGLRHTF